MVSQTDIIILGLGAVLAVLYLYKDSIFGSKDGGVSSKLVNGHAGGAGGDALESEGDFVQKLKSQNKRIVIFYGSQTGTAEEYAVKIAKEAKARFGTSSLVCDPEEYEFDKLDSLPEDAVAVFVMATYGEGEPTDNAVPLMEFVKDEGVSFKEGERLENLKYVIFGLGNRTYEHFNAVARNLDNRLASLGAKRIGERGEGDDDKSMEEDYLAWKDGMFDALQKEVGFEEGGGGEVQDFEVKELDAVDKAKVYMGELSARALLGTKGIHDAKNPFPAPVKATRELFALDGERSCVHMEFDIEGSGISYQHGDHVAVWANNPEEDVERILAVLGLSEKRDTPIHVESLDPTLAKVPFPVPTTYEAIFRHYLDISSQASRQALSGLAKFAPNDQAREALERMGKDRAFFQEKVASLGYKTAEALQAVAGDDVTSKDFSKSTAWTVPFDRIISSMPRLGPRFYSISSSPKLHPKAIHLTAVVLRYLPDIGDKHIYGLATNYLSQVKAQVNGEQPDSRFDTPNYALAGPRNSYKKEDKVCVPIHVRRSTFRLPTSPKIPVIMVGPGTGVAPFRSFVQERVAAAQKSKEKNGADALVDWGKIWLFYTSRRRNEDFLYADEWPQCEKELGDRFQMVTGFSREQFKDGGKKKYVQDYIIENGDALAEDILQRKAYVYVCGATDMSHDVEKAFIQVLAKAKGGSEEEGKKEIKTLKERSRFLQDVWS